MSDSWPPNVWRHIPSRKSHNFAVASQAPDINVFLSSVTDNDITSPVCPVKAVVCIPVSISHSALKIKKKNMKKYSDAHAPKKLWESFVPLPLKQIEQEGPFKPHFKFQLNLFPVVRLVSFL